MPLAPDHFLDRLIGEADHALRTIAGPARAARPTPARPDADECLNSAERDLSARLMRVNHAGEIAAQALYRGQALTTRDNALQQSLLQAADEEHDHLAWCAERVEALGDRTSRLAPLWYGGAFAIGSLAGLAGDRFSLGFLEETERQVGRHLDEHLGRLPAGDRTSRRIVAQMKDEELAHGAAARALGAGTLDAPVKAVMGRVSRVMTRLAFWL